MRTQRKIYHLLDSIGTGKDFRYLKKINPKHNFNWDKPIWITDKIDGTTVQANNQGIFKRKDKFKKGDPKKYDASEEERYELIEIHPYQKEWKWVFEGIFPYVGIMSKLPDGVTIYFEALGSKINARYKGLEKHDIRLFDIAIDDEYVLFEDVIFFNKFFKLPIVGYFKANFSLDYMFANLPYIHHQEHPLVKYEVEGWVIRQGYEIAKIRKADLKRIE